LSLDNILPWFTVIAILTYLPFLIRMDLKDREVPYNTWIGMLPFLLGTGYLYAVGYYPIECIWVSLAFVSIYWIAMKAEAFEGADFTLLMFISLIYVQNPVSGHYFTPVHVLIYLLCCWVAVNFAAFAFNKNFWRFPLIPVIAAAFVLAVVLG
jgi:hypothetical protein